MKPLFAILLSALLTLAAAPLAFAESQSTTHQAAHININTADAETLASLKGIGSKKAEDIIAWRDTHGPFTSVDQLAEVRGIGAATLDANRNQLTLE